MLGTRLALMVTEKSGFADYGSNNGGIAMKRDGIKGNIARALVGCAVIGVAAAWVAGCGSGTPPPTAPVAVAAPPVGPAVAEDMEQFMGDHGAGRGAAAV